MKSGWKGGQERSSEEAASDSQVRGAAGWGGGAEREGGEGVDGV